MSNCTCTPTHKRDEANKDWAMWKLWMADPWQLRGHHHAPQCPLYRSYEEEEAELRELAATLNEEARQ